MDIKVQWVLVVKNFLTLGKAEVLLTKWSLSGLKWGSSRPPTVLCPFHSCVSSDHLCCTVERPTKVDESDMIQEFLHTGNECRLGAAETRVHVLCSVMTLQFRNGFCSSSTLFFEFRIQEFAYYVLFGVTLVTNVTQVIFCASSPLTCSEVNIASLQYYIYLKLHSHVTELS